MVVGVWGGKGCSLVEVIAVKYGEDKWRWWPKLKPNYCRSEVWRAIAMVGDESNSRGEALYKGVGFYGGDCREVRSWLDDWIGVGFQGF